MRILRQYTFLLLSVLMIFSACGCATLTEGLKRLVGISTQDLEKIRKNATARVFEKDYKACRKAVEKGLPKIKGAVIYENDPKRDMIAIYYVDVNTTPVGIFFKEVDPAHTEIGVASEAPDAQAYIAKKLFFVVENPDTKPPEDEPESPFRKSR